MDISVAVPHYFDAGPEPNPTVHSAAAPEPDSTLQFDADPDPYPTTLFLRFGPFSAPN
jgi:hypothetical protein